MGKGVYTMTYDTNKEKRNYIEECSICEDIIQISKFWQEGREPLELYISLSELP